MRKQSTTCNKSRCALLPCSSQPSNHGPPPDSKDLEPRAGLQILPSPSRLSCYRNRDLPFFLRFPLRLVWERREGGRPGNGTWRLGTGCGRVMAPHPHAPWCCSLRPGRERSNGKREKTHTFLGMEALVEHASVSARRQKPGPARLCVWRGGLRLGVLLQGLSRT